jgi:hypothetical protein
MKRFLVKIIQANNEILKEKIILEGVLFQNGIIICHEPGKREMREFYNLEVFTRYYLHNLFQIEWIDQ